LADNPPVHLWKAFSQPQTGGFTHQIRGGIGHPWLVPIVSSVFEALRVSASLCDGEFWYSIHSEPDLIRFEKQHVVESQRWAYNARKFAEVRRRKRTVCGVYSGYTDVFAPIVVQGAAVAILVVGPFATARPTAKHLLKRWRWLTGRPGDPAEPEFSSYFRTTLSTLVLEGKAASRFERLVGYLAELMAGAGRADEIANRATALRVELERSRFVDRAWDAARAMVDARYSRAEYSAASDYPRKMLGLSRAADQVSVGLFLARVGDMDPVEEGIRRDAFQRAAVDLARAEGDVLSGRVGDHGVMFLFGAKASAERRKQKVLAFSDRALGLARRCFGLSLHFGVSLGSGARELPQTYQAALGAAEVALTQRQKLVIAAGLTVRPADSLRHLREQLCRTVKERPALLPVQFESYLEAVAIHCHSRSERALLALDLCVERVAEALLASGGIDAKSVSAMSESLDRARDEPRDLAELFAAYRTAVTDLANAAQNPTAARQDRSLRAALDHIHRHYDEPLRMHKVASLAGFAAPYFSQLFRSRQGTTFEKYVFKLRLERAKQLLTGTE
jgi:hypothetical protein